MKNIKILYLESIIWMSGITSCTVVLYMQFLASIYLFHIKGNGLQFCSHAFSVSPKI